MPQIGLQLYTLRDEVARDLQGTLARVGDLGYAGIEGYPIEGSDPQEVRRWLDDAGLAVAGWHAPLAVLEERLDQALPALETLGTRRVTLAWIEPPTTRAAADELVGRIVAVAERVQANGLAFGFHNHDGELRALEDGRSFLDRLLETPADLVELELDLGWIWEAGVDPVDLLRRAAGRCPLVHVKDFAIRGERAFAPVGDGGVGYERVVPAAVEAGVEWLLVEQDETDGPPFEAVERSLTAVRRFLA